jgi:hypothetical protein
MKASENPYPSVLLDEQASDIATPASDRWVLFAKSGGIYARNAAGTVVGPFGATGGLGAWTDYTPALTADTTNPTLGSSTLTGRYKQLDAKTYLVKCVLTVTTGGAWNAGSGQWRFSLPAGLTASSFSVGSVALLDNGVRRYAGSAIVESGNTYIGPCVIADAGSDATLRHNIPVVPATGDKVELQITVEVA